jgi:tetratricopeptide (TPR) repeat protein
MRMQRPGKNLVVLLLALAGLGWLGTRWLGARARAERQDWPDAEGLVWLPPPRAATTVAMGYRQLWADINWARVLVYYSQERRERPTFQYRYLTRFLDNIVALDPKFKRVYEWATYAVTFQGGTLKAEEHRLSLPYLERAMKEFPDTYRFFWLAGLRYYIYLESDDPAERRRMREHGAALIERAMHKPDAPTNITTLAAGLRTQLGQHERALDNLRQVIMTTEDPEAQKTLIQTYRNLAGKEFPEEATRAKAELQRGWMAELPFASPNMYVALGDRPAATFDLEALVAEQDLFSKLLEEPATEDEALDAADAGGEPTTDASNAGSQPPESANAGGEPATDAANDGSEPARGAAGSADAPAQRGATATPVP